MDEEDETIANSIATKFEPLILTDSEVLYARAAVSEYVVQAARNLEHNQLSEADPRIPGHFTGLYRRYLEAVKANIRAKQEYTSVLEPKEHNPSQKASIPLADQNSQLRTYLDLLRQQRYQSRLVVVEQYEQELERLSLENKVYDLSTSNGTDDEMLVGDADVKIAVTAARNTITKLELAVIQAKHELAVGRSKLQTAKASLTSSSVVDEQTQLRALDAVRRELTTWVESSLAKCSATVLLPIETNRNTCVDKIEDSQIEQQYETYLEARRNLLKTVASLKMPLSNMEETAQVHSNKIPEQINGCQFFTDDLLEFEQRYLEKQSSANMRQMQGFAQSQLAGNNAVTLDTLHKLADESHLLSTYPMLAKSQNFQNAKAVFGREQPNIRNDRISEKVEAWTFASQIAAESTQDAISGHLRQGMTAAEGVQENLQDLQSLKDVVEKLKQ